MHRALLTSSRRPASARVLVTCGALAISLAASSGAAHAYGVKLTSKGAKIHWAQRLVPIVVASTGDPKLDQLLEEAVHGAARAWIESSNVVIDVRIADPGTADIGFDPGGVNQCVIKWAQGRWTYDPSTLALTFLRYDVDSGSVLDADIVVNDANFAWVDRMTVLAEEGGIFDLQNTLTHEIGHALGLAHSNVEPATMFGSTAPFDTDKRVLDSDDVAGVQTLYGTEDPAGSVPIDPSGVGCTTVANARFDLGLWALLLAGAAMMLRRRFVHVARRTRLVWLALGAVAIGVSPAAEATERARIGSSIEGVVQRSDAVVRGTVIAQRVEARADGVLVTLSEVRVERCLAGRCPERIVVEQLGGELNGVGLDVEGITPLERGATLILATRATGERWNLVDLDHGRLLDLRAASAKEISVLEAKIAGIMVKK